MNPREIRHFHLFCGLGGGAAGFNRASPRAGTLTGRMRCIGGIDSDPAAIRDFGRLAGTPGTVMDLFDRHQYQDWHGTEPPADWQEAMPDDIRRAAGNERPHIVFTSAPCKGFSGLLGKTRSETTKYQALNRLTIRGIWLTLEAWADDPPELIIFENVPRIASRGTHLIDQITALLHHAGYAVATSTHDCGTLGGLAQSRKRFLLVARHRAKVPAYLYEPHRHPLRGVGSVLDTLPLPGDPVAGPMHRVPNLAWKTWVRLAFVEAGQDWRSLNRLAVQDGYLRDYLIVPQDHRRGYLGVHNWHSPSGTIAGRAGPTNGAFSVADPRRPSGSSEYGQYGVLDWAASAGAVTGQSQPGGGRYSVADPRTGWPAGTHQTKYRIVPWTHPAGTVTGSDRVGSGAPCVADPRPASFGSSRHAYQTAGHYGVLGWQDTAGAITAAGQHDNGRWSVADPRLPAPNDNGVFVIQSLDGTWHRPFTTLELAALQGLISADDLTPLDGRSDSAWRERIGNAVPPDAARAIATEMGRTLLLSWAGQSFSLSATPVWVRPALAGLTMEH